VSAELRIEGLVVAPPGTTPVLRGVELAVPAGERAVLAGPSGAGKTTLLRAIAGLEDPAAGTIALGGSDQTGVPAHRRRMAMVFQDPRLLPHASVLDNIALPLRAAGVKRAERRRLAGEQLEEVGMAAFAERRVAGLSGGEAQRVALARALCAEPELLLLDEPLAALDPRRREALRRLIAELQERRSLTCLIVTHDRAEAAELGQSLALMIEGRIVQHDDPRTIFERPATRAVARFFGASNLLELPEHPGRVLAIRPEHVAIGSGTLRATVLESVYRGTQVALALDWQGRRIEALIDPADAPAAGATIAFELPAERLWAIPQTADERDLELRE